MKSSDPRIPLRGTIEPNETRRILSFEAGDTVHGAVFILIIVVAEVENV
jgi:hypothetical protein